MKTILYSIIATLLLTVFSVSFTNSKVTKNQTEALNQVGIENPFDLQNIISYE